MSESKSLRVAQSRAVAPIIPQSTDEITRVATFMMNANALPKSYIDTRIEDPKDQAIAAVRKASIAIMKGLEIGWLPMQSVQNMYVINGIPTIYGDGAIALARASSQLEYCKEWVDGDGDKRTAYCEVLRKGEPAPVVRSFSKEQAAKAGLLGKSGPWQQYQDRMLQMRARAYALRDTFADVLMGLRIKEEVEDYEIEEAPAPKINPFADKAEAVDVEVEPVGEPMTAAEVEDLTTENMDAATAEEHRPPFADPEAALASMYDSLPTFKTIKDVEEYTALWIDMVKDSFPEPADTLTAGKRMAATRKAALTKAKG